MHFSTFLKLLTQDSGEKIRDLEKYGRPGGWDFWRPMRDGMEALVAHDRDRSAVEADIRANSAANALERNLGVFVQSASWLERQSGRRFAPGRAVWRSPDGLFSVQIEPEVGIETRNGEQTIASIYPRAEPRIRRDQAGAAIILMERAFRPSNQATYAVLDAGGNILHKARSNVSQQLLDAEVAFIDRELARVLN